MQNEIKRKKQMMWARDQKANIIFLQETHSDEKTEYIWRKQWNSEAIFAHGTSQARGTAILFSKNLNVHIIDRTIDTEGRYVWLTVDIDGCNLELMNIYAPNEKQEQLQFYDWFANTTKKEL